MHRRGRVVQHVLIEVHALDTLQKRVRHMTEGVRALCPACSSQGGRQPARTFPASNPWNVSVWSALLREGWVRRAPPQRSSVPGEEPEITFCKGSPFFSEIAGAQPRAQACQVLLQLLAAGGAEANGRGRGAPGSGRAASSSSSSCLAAWSKSTASCRAKTSH